MYKVIPIYQNYEISAYGLVRNKNTKKQLKTKHLGRYLSIGLYVDGLYKYHNIHRLVAMAWISIPDGYDKLQVAHNDGDSMNNHHSNLRWVTPKENASDKYIHGTAFNCKEAEDHHAAKLTKELVAKLRSMAKNNDCMELSIIFGIPKLTIYDAVTGKTWKSVNDMESPVNLSGRQYKRSKNARNSL
jgi:hypothetical protein